MQVAPGFRLSKFAETYTKFTSPSEECAACPPMHWYSGYSPTYLTHVTEVYEDGRVDLCAVVYLPGSHRKNSDDPSEKETVSAVQVKVDGGEWQSLSLSNDIDEYWSLDLKRVREGSQLYFRYQGDRGEWKAISPLGNVESLYGNIYVPSLKHTWQNDPPKLTHARVLMETTLEGLLAGYKGGKFAPRGIEELHHRSISERILETDIPGQLADWGVDEIMVPVCSSVANRAMLDPKFNYLTYNFADIDWQIGQPAEFKRLIDKLYEHNLQLIPDLIFAHQVRSPFEGSMDRVTAVGEENSPFVDWEAFLFRDYGTWMLNLAVPEIRRMLVEKLVSFVTRYRLKTIRIDYIDGLILQYSNRQENYGEQLIRELKDELNRVCPDVLTLGETFETAHNDAVKRMIDIFYSPAGFTILEEVYRLPPEGAKEYEYQPNVGAIAAHINQILSSDRREAFYAQLHDETWYCPHVAYGRPSVPWAYGSHPAQLAKQHGESLIQRGLLDPEQLLDYVRRMVRNVEALTMFLADFKYMFTPGVDSLSLGCLDDPDEWKVNWQGVPERHMKQWRQTGLNSREIFHFHDQHREDMVTLRNIFRMYTKIDEESHTPLVRPILHHVNAQDAILSLFRYSQRQLDDCLLIIFNFGSRPFRNDKTYELPIPEGLVGDWEVLFDGDWVSSEHQAAIGRQVAYEPGAILKATTGQYSNQANVLPVGIGARSLVVLKFQPDQ